MRRFDQGIDAPNIAFKKAKRKTPDHMGNVLIMLAGCSVATVIALVCLVMVFSDNPVFQAAGILGVVFVCASMYVVLTNPAYWQTVETITGHDLDGDGHVGAPPRTVSIEISNPGNNNLQYLQIPETLFEKLPMIAHLLRAGKPFSEGAMCGTGRPLSRSEFHSLRDVLFDRGLATWRNAEHPTLGVILTARGKSVMRQAEELSTTPPRMHTPRQQNVLPAQSVGEWGKGE